MISLGVGAEVGTERRVVAMALRPVTPPVVELEVGSVEITTELVSRAEVTIVTRTVGGVRSHLAQFRQSR